MIRSALEQKQLQSMLRFLHSEFSHYTLWKFFSAFLRDGTNGILYWAWSSDLVQFLRNFQCWSRDCITWFHSFKVRRTLLKGRLCSENWQFLLERKVSLFLSVTTYDATKNQNPIRCYHLVNYALTKRFLSVNGEYVIVKPEIYPNFLRICHFLVKNCR